MRQIFDAELRLLGDDLVIMAERVETAISAAGRALATADLALAETVIAQDDQIDALNRQLDEQCVHLLAQQQPVATDLRIVVSGLRMAGTLERMGDLARHVAQVARLRYPDTAVPPELRDTFAGMHEASVHLAQRVVGLLQTRDLAVAETIQAEDDLLDRLHAQVFSAQLSGEWTGTPQQTVDSTLLSRYYERFGDHGVSIARRIIYLVTGDMDEMATNA